MNIWSGRNLFSEANVLARLIAAAGAWINENIKRGFLKGLSLQLFCCLVMVCAGSPITKAFAAKELSIDTVRAVALDISHDDSSARLVLTLSAPVDARAFLLEQPDRIIVDLPQVAFNIPVDSKNSKKLTHRTSLIASYRYGLFTQGHSRIVIDLKEPAIVTKILNEPAENGATLTIELIRSDRAAYTRAAMQPMIESAAAHLRSENNQVAAAAQITPYWVQTSARADRPLIMIDPGHGGIDPGASHGQLQEKDLVFSFATRLRNKIEETGRYRVQLTRNDDSFISLGGRVRIAREAQADLFISIHADSIGGHEQVRGATVYTNSNIPTDAESAQLAMKENLSDKFAGVETVLEADNVVGILADLTRRETQALSRVFAERTIDTLRSHINLNRNPHRSAQFLVLRAPDVPSILLELGYLSSDDDVALLTSPEWQDKTVSALVSALDRFFEHRIAVQERSKG